MGRTRLSRLLEKAGDPRDMRLFLVWGVLCIVLTVMHTFAVANGAHFGGLLFGLAVGNLFFSHAVNRSGFPHSFCCSASACSL